MLHKISKGLLAGALMFTAACQMAPTRVSVTQARPFAALLDKTQKPIELTDTTVILDARSAFDYGLNRVQNSRSFPWQNLAENPQSGEMLRDLRKAALKLSLIGIMPGTPVVVIGYGPNGQGEEGRLAWTLLYLGIPDVQVGTFDLFRKNWTQAQTPPATNVAQWNPEPRADMMVGTEEFRALAADPKGRTEKKIWLIDVRSTAEYFNKDANQMAVPDVGAVNIEWKEFYTREGRPNRLIRKKLSGLGVSQGDRIVLVSNRGVRSAAAAYALTALGFTHAQNFAGGWRSLVK